MWNTDYLEFLVERVWKINQPVNLVDFGCGIGFLGALLLPILPDGSTYTGIDKGGQLLMEAKSIFAQSPYETHFIEADLNDYVPEEKYDIAICQCVLQHIPDAIKILKKMKSSVFLGGMVICIELNRDISNAGLYFDGLDYSKLNVLGVVQKLRRFDFERSGKDFGIGIKLPYFMQKIELEDIGVRVNDYVNFINPLGNKADHEVNLESYLSAYASVMEINEGSKDTYVSALTNRGLSTAEAICAFECELSIANYMTLYGDNSFIMDVTGMLISYGTKRNHS